MKGKGKDVPEWLEKIEEKIPLTSQQRLLLRILPKHKSSLYTWDYLKMPMRCSKEELEQVIKDVQALGVVIVKEETFYFDINTTEDNLNIVRETDEEFLRRIGQED